MLDADTTVLIVYSLAVWFAGLGVGIIIGSFMP